MESSKHSYIKSECVVSTIPSLHELHMKAETLPIDNSVGVASVGLCIVILFETHISIACYCVYAA